MIKNDLQSAILDFISEEFVMGYPCAGPYIFFYVHGPLFCFFFELLKFHKITKHIRQIKKNMMETFS